MLSFLSIEDSRPLSGEAFLRRDLEELCAEYPEHLIVCQVIGRSEKGQPILGLKLGHGARHASLMAGAHADEPVGSLTLNLLVRGLLQNPEAARPLLEQFTFFIVPHVNPDGAAANQNWIEKWPDPLICLRNSSRELPGRDIEFGYPSLRSENQAAADFLAEQAPFVLHMSLHGMLVSEGGQLLIEKSWVPRTENLRRAYAQSLQQAGLGLFDYDRAGEKGFDYLGPGFATTPTGTAMRAHFEAAGDVQTAAGFHQSSMEYVQSLGGDPLCLVTELPLWLLSTPTPAQPVAGRPQAYLSFRQLLPQLRHRLETGQPTAHLLSGFQIRAVEVAQAVQLQLRAIELGLQTVMDAETK